MDFSTWGTKALKKQLEYEEWLLERAKAVDDATLKAATTRRVAEIKEAIGRREAAGL